VRNVPQPVHGWTGVWAKVVGGVGRYRRIAPNNVKLCQAVCGKCEVCFFLLDLHRQRNQPGYMSEPHRITLLILVIILSEYYLNSWFSWLNISTYKKRVPDLLKRIITEDTYLKSAQYQKEHYNLSSIVGFKETLILLIVLGAGWFGGLNDYLHNTIVEPFRSPVTEGLAYFTVISLVSYTLNLPFSVYQTFRIEERFGFNRTTVKTFIADQLKGAAAGAVIGGSLLSLLILYLSWDFRFSWILASVSIIAVSLLINFYYTDFILPIFNKLTPLDNENLRAAVTLLSEKTDFPISEIYIMDGSKRSSKANAFFSGFGKRKKIILFDTLVTEYSQPELMAVLAHEIGHYKKKHIIKNMVFGSVHSVAMIYLLFLFVSSSVLSQALGAAEAGINTGLTAFAFLYSPFSLVLGVVVSWFSRKYEFEADDFAKEHTSGRDLASALRKMSIDHLSNLHPHPFYVFVHYSHPPALTRIERLLS
jgi:STE24 endopeptidase